MASTFVREKKIYCGENYLEVDIFQYTETQVRRKKRSKRESLFSKITCLFFKAKQGGALSENCKIWLPTGELFHGLSYKGDIVGWREGIIEAAIHLGLLTAKIVRENIEISDGRNYALSECKVEFY